MKKLLVIGLSLCVLLNLTACGKNEETQPESFVTNESGGEVVSEPLDEEREETTVVESNEDKEAPQVYIVENERLPYVFGDDINGQQFYMDVPKSHIEYGFSCRWSFDETLNGDYKAHSDLLLLEAKYDFEADKHRAVTDLDIAYGLIMEEFLVVEHSVGTGASITSIDTVTKEFVTVNGIDTIRFVATANHESLTSWGAHVYGYVFTDNGCPMCLCGVVTDETQPQEEIDRVHLYVDDMIKTVRHELNVDLGVVPWDWTANVY